MHESTLGFLTPQPKIETSMRRSSSRHTHRPSSHRKPIFGPKTNATSLRQSMVFNPYHASFEQQSVSTMQVLNFDFCGCESKMTPCEIIEKTFFKGVSLSEMRESYMETTEGLDSNRLTAQKRNLFKSLPKQYPEVYFSHLNNLLRLWEGEISVAQFNCLAWIQYHTKVEYVTYFLYKDLKQSFTHQQKFMEHLDYQLSKSGTNYNSLTVMFSSKGYGEIFNSFVLDYYDSVGANLVPLTQYAKFMRAIFEKGFKVFLRLILRFFTLGRAELSEGLKFLAHGEVERYLNYMRELNWDIYIEELQA